MKEDTRTTIAVLLAITVIASLIFMFKTAAKGDQETRASIGRFEKLDTFQFMNGYSFKAYIYQDKQTGICVLVKNAGRTSTMTQWPCPDGN